MKASTVAVSRDLQGIAADLDKAITASAGERMGWSLIVFTEGRASYISNCDRPEVVAAMKELLTAWGAGLPDIPAHEIT